MSGHNWSMEPQWAEKFSQAGMPAARRHVFLCPGPDCCHAAEGQAAWDQLKKRVREDGIPVMRTKAACFRLCEAGPWLVVYPEGIWYNQVTPEKIDRICREHLAGGVPVTEWVQAAKPLPG